MGKQACVLSCFSHVWLYAALWTVAARLLCQWGSLGKNTGVGCHALLQGIFQTQGCNPHLRSPALAGEFFTASTIWEAPLVSCAVLSRFSHVWLFVSIWTTMAPHSNTLAWELPWTEEPGRLQSMGSLRVAYDWATSLSLFTFMHWRRKWQPTPVFLPGESQGRGSLVGFHLWGHTELDTTEVT